MHYKGFNAGIRFNEKETRFDGIVLGASAELEFHGKTVDELRERFEGQVNKHLSRCSSTGVDPFEKYSGKLVLRFDPEMHRESVAAAYKDGVSLNAWLVAAIENRIPRKK